MITSEPPLTLDGAMVLYSCSLGPPVQPTGRHAIHQEDGSISIPANVAICRYPDNLTIYRFYCDDNWNVVTDMDYPSVEEAIEAIEHDYVGVQQRIQKPSPHIAQEHWYVMSCDFPDLNWARLRIYADGTAETFDVDGCTIRFANEEVAQQELTIDEYVKLDDLDEMDEAALHRQVTMITPPHGNTDSELVPQMYQRFHE
jgi:hypothetical protein